MAETRTPQETPLDVTLRDNGNTTSPTANQTGRVYSSPKTKPAPVSPAKKGGDIGPKAADWSPMNRKKGDKKGLIN